MLRIRLTRTGKSGQPSYRLVVAEHTAPIKGKFVEIVGHYNLAREPRLLEVKEDRIQYWISVGAKPTDTVASLLKKMGMADMDKFIDTRTKKRKPKKERPEEAPAATVSEAAPKVSEAPAEEPTPATEETPVESAETPAEEPAPAPEEAVAEAAPAETPAAEEAPTEEATPAEEAPTEEATPAEEEPKRD